MNLSPHIFSGRHQIIFASSRHILTSDLGIDLEANRRLQISSGLRGSQFEEGCFSSHLETTGGCASSTPLSFPRLSLARRDLGIG